MSQADAGPLTPGTDDSKELRRLWFWMLLLGTILLILGFVAISHVLWAAEVSVLVFGYLLLIDGGMQTAFAVLARCWKGFFIHLLDGVLCLLVGALFLKHPEKSIAIIVFVLAIFFIIEGSMRMAVGLVWPLPHRVWQFLSGLVSVALGALVWSKWPADSWYFFGIFVGIDLVMNGLSLIMLAQIARRAGPVMP